MKTTSVFLALSLSVAVSATPAAPAAPELIFRDTPKGTIDCNYCTAILNFCFKVRYHIPKLHRG